MLYKFSVLCPNLKRRQKLLLAEQAEIIYSGVRSYF